MSDTPWRCAVLDDEPLAIQLLEDYIRRVPMLQLVAGTYKPADALHLINAGAIDVLFLDLQMPEVHGMNLLPLCQGKCKVILTTAYPQYALESYEHEVLDYLLKPIAFERFLKCIQRLSSASKTNAPAPVTNVQAPFLFLKVEHRLQKVLLEDILYIESYKDYSRVFTTTEKIMTLQLLKQLESNLPASQFIRVHKSYIVALSKIDFIERQRIHLADKIIPIGDAYREQLMAALHGK
jgi:DNA-binding LytR/AlgR family response regulator